MKQQWYALRIWPNSERLAADSLSRVGLNVLIPLVKSPLLGGDFKEVPVFPGYLFIQCDIRSERMNTIRNHPGVLGWVRFGDSVPSVPDKAIKDLADRIERLNAGGGLWARFRVGDRVRIIHGAMDSFGKVLEETISPHGRVKVLLEFMGSMVSAEVPRHSLQPIKEADPEMPRRRPRRTRGRGRWTNGFRPKAVASFPI